MSGSTTYECVACVSLPCECISLWDCESAARAFERNRALQRVDRKRFQGVAFASVAHVHGRRDEDGAGGQRQVRKNT